MNNRAGDYQKQAGGFNAFIPKTLPPDPPIRYDEELLLLLSDAERYLARLDGIASVLPNPDLFVGMYVKKEALLSSQIEGTQASLEGVLEFEADLKPKDDINEIKEVINYVKALDHGIDELKRRSLSTALIKEMHKILIQGTRGAGKTPGEFRTKQNWIGPEGATIIEAIFVPPPVENVVQLMSDLEKFMTGNDRIPPLVKIGMIHAQFETIHPFRDGNGRTGRLLITLYLLWKGILSRPLLYLSFFLKKYRSQYYDILMKIRNEGNWEEWINFFLEGIKKTSDEASKTAREIIKLKDSLIDRLYEKSISSIHAVKLINLLFEMPVIAITDVITRIGISKDTATELINKFEAAGIIEERTGKQRYKKYMFKDYVEIIARGTQY